MNDLAVTYDAPPTLGRFLGSDAFVRCVMGPVGGGKSSACVLEILRRAVGQEPGPDGVRRTRFAVVRNHYRELSDTTRKTFEQWIPPHLGKWNEQGFTFTMRFNDVHCEVMFRALDRPDDVSKLLSLELTGAYFNEFREIARSIFDLMQARVGRYPSKIQGGPTWFGVWADTNPWHNGHWASRAFKSNPDGFELFRQPSGRSAEAENVENLPAGYYDRLCIGKDEDWVKVYVDGEEANSDLGSIYGKWFDALDQRGAISDFQHGADGVFTSWDIGGAGAKGDATAIWFWRFNEHRVPDVIDWYEAQGEGLSHYLDLLERKARENGYQYVKHWLPHDARAKTLQTGMSTLDRCIQEWGADKVAISPQLSLADGIGAVRWLLERPVRFHSRCAEGVEALREYRYEWDEANRCFSKVPLHNWASHSADGMRYLAIVAKATNLIMRKPEPKTGPVAVPLDKSFTLDKLFEENERNRSSGSGRI